LAVAEEGMDASGKSLHAPCARDASFGKRRCVQTPDCPADRGGAVDGAPLKRFAASGLSWPLGDEVTDAVLEARMYRNAGKKAGHRQYAEPDWAWVHRELKRKHVTLSILWDEYIAQHPDGYRYSRYVAAARYRRAYLGLVPRRYQSGEIDYTGGISKCGDRRVRTLLYEAANVMLTRYKGPLKLKTWALAISKRPNMRKARVALARRLAIIMHAMLRDGTDFASA
jgi:hypothetical protein